MCSITFEQHYVVVPITGFSSEFSMNTYFNLLSKVFSSLVFAIDDAQGSS